MSQSSGSVQCLVAAAKAKPRPCPRSTGTACTGFSSPRPLQGKGTEEGEAATQQGSQSLNSEQSQTVFPDCIHTPSNWLALARHTTAVHGSFLKGRAGLWTNSKTAPECSASPALGIGFRSVSSQERDANSERPSRAAQAVPGAAVEEVLGQSWIVAL